MVFSIALQGHCDALGVQADQREFTLAHDPTWLKLGHYKPSDFSLHKKYRSDIYPGEFFLASSGRNDPSAELHATIAAMALPDNLTTEQHAQCKYPARYLWLKKVMPETVRLWPVAACAEFRSWSQAGKIDSISVYYASGYFENPASFYGHILLKFNAKEIGLSAGLLDKAFNYGAILSGKDNALMYVAKGLLGGYDAAFSNDAFYVNQYQYGEEEFRDLWAYQLALSPDDTALVVSHLWELRGAKFQYYFFKQNCAYRFAEVLELPGAWHLNDHYKPWAIPASIFHNLAEQPYGDGRLVKSVAYYPSRQKRLYKKFTRLNKNSQNAVLAMVAVPEPLAAPEFTKLNEEEQNQVLSVLVDYQNFLVKKKIEPEVNAAKKVDFMKLQATRKSKAVQLGYDENPPDEAHKPSMLRLGVAKTRDGRIKPQLQIRPAFYDLLSSGAGVMPFSQLEMFNLEFYYDGDIDKAYLHDVDFINIVNLNLSQVGLPHDGGWAWAIRAGIEQTLTACQSCLTPFISGGYGKAVQSSDQTFVTWAMLEGRLENDYGDFGALSFNPTLGVVYRPNAVVSSQLSVSERLYTNNVATRRTLLSWQNRLRLARDFDVRANYSKDWREQIELGLSWYW